MTVLCIRSFITCEIFLQVIIPRGGYTLLALSVLPSATDIFRLNFLKHASQPLQTWYGALARSRTRRIPNLGLPPIYFLFTGSVLFWTLHLGI